VAKDIGKYINDALADDPLLNFKPSPIQALFLHSPSWCRYISGPNRAGKTLVNCIDAAMIARGIHPVRKFDHRVRMLILTNTRSQAAGVFGRKLFTASELPGKYHDSPLIPARDLIAPVSYVTVGIKVPYVAQTKHAEILFSWSGVDDIWERLQGLQLDAIYLDEDAGDESLTNELFMRGLDARGAPGAPPYAGSMSWSATPTCGSEGLRKFKKHCQENMPSESFFQIQVGDNPSISAEAITKARSFLGEDASAIRVDATMDAEALTLIYGPQWDDNRHMLKADYEVQPDDNLWMSYDPGVDHPTGMLVAAISAKNPIKQHWCKFFLHRRQTVEYDARVLYEWLRGRVLAGIVYDTAAKNIDKTGNSTLSHLQRAFQELHISPLAGWYQSKKQHTTGIALMRHYLDPDPFNKLADPLIQISPSVESGGARMREQLLRYRGKESTRFSGPGGVIKKEDEGPDCGRYLCCKRPAYNPEWACGIPTMAPVAITDQFPTGMVQLPSPIPGPQNHYERHLLLSKERVRSVRGWTLKDL
jgi:hypothetical protein